MVNTSLHPYYDDFDSAKKYAQILAIPGRAEQAREFTQAQTSLLYIIRKLSEAVLKEGSIISGMDLVIKGNEVTVGAGRIYLNGIIHDFDGQTLVISRSGEEKICARLLNSIVTEAEDSTLRDPAQEYKNSGQPGAHRLKYEVSLVINDTTVPSIYTLYDGALQLDNQKPELDIITDLLAKRMFDESGNYLVSGMSMYTKPFDENNITLVVDAGKAYVKGYEVNRPSPAYITLPKSQETRDVVGELKVYHTGTNLYKLNNPNAKEITQVIATVRRTKTITRGTVTNGMDLLPDTPVLTIESVSQGATNYSAGVDYQLSGDSVDWSLGGVEPSIGSTYDVTFTYNKELVYSTDYVLTNQNGSSYLDLSPSGDDPVNSGNMTVTYDYYLSRGYRVYLDKDGVITLFPGQSDTPSLVMPPEDKDFDRLSLGTIVLSPNSDNAIIKGETINRLSMKDLSLMKTRIENLEYNIALSDLDNEAMSGQSPTAMKGILTDGFLGFSKADLGHPLFNAAIDVSNNLLELPSTYSFYKPEIETSASNYRGTTNYLIGDYSEEAVVGQYLSTGAVNVNPYKVFGSAPGMSPFPSVDNWIDQSTIVVNGGTQTKTNFVSKWWQAGQSSQVNTSYNVIEGTIPYARQIQITIAVSNLPPFSDSYTASIGGIGVNLSPINGTSAGTVPGSIKASADGSAYATFVIPAGLRTGTSKIILSNGVYSTEALFTSSGINRVTQAIQVTQTTINTLQRRTDPVAQTFQLPVDRMVSSCRLWFFSKDASVPVTVQLRNVVNGYPGIDVLASSTLYPNQVGISSNGQSYETKFNFNNPVLCKANVQYCIVVLTPSDKYQLHKATLGENELSTGRLVTTQPYTDGILFMSSNGLTWSADQSSDLKFELIGAVFGAGSNNSKTLQFKPLTGLDADGLLAMMDFDLPTGTSIQWQYKLGSGSWLPIVANRLLDIPVSTSVTLRAILGCTRALSPIVLLDSCSIITSKMDTSGIYVGRLVTTSQAYTTVKVIMESALPTGTTVVPKISIDNINWVSLTQSSAESTSDAEYTRFTYSYVIPASGTSTQYRCRIDLATSTRTSKPKVRKLLNILT